MSKHTPGPWVAYGADRSGASVRADGAHGVDVAFCGTNGTYGKHGSHTISSEEAAANARLISAAPELLAALEHVLVRLDIDSKALADLGVDPPQWWACPEARAAIAKARGE